MESYKDITTPIGTLRVSANETGLTNVTLLNNLQEDFTSEPSSNVILEEAELQLKAYFSGTLKQFDLPLDSSGLTAFQLKALKVTSQIPFGAVITYGELARLAGSPRGARAAGGAMAHNPFMLVVPCHRVVASDGSMHGYSAEGEIRTKQRLLEFEGHKLVNGKIVFEKRDILETQNENFKSGFIALVGKPNAGKSTLLNQIMGQPIAGVSFKPQTTRRRQLGILTTEDYQMIFTDTPGLNNAKDKLSQFINNEVKFALEDADVLLFIADISKHPDELDRDLAALIKEKRSTQKVILVFNKSDLAGPGQLSQNKQAFQSLFPEDPSIEISARIGKGVTKLIEKVHSLLPVGPEYYPTDQITEDFERDIAAELVRAVAMENLDDELPYSIATQVDEYKERDNDVLYIHGTIYVEREAQKGMVVGRKGMMIRKISTDARLAIEEMTKSKVFLDLQVKTHKDWKNDPAFLSRIGLAGAGDNA
jgi:GTP-binding protein Era